MASGHMVSAIAEVKQRWAVTEWVAKSLLS
jgi:hypothetical protein